MPSRAFVPLLCLHEDKLYLETTNPDLTHQGHIWRPYCHSASMPLLQIQAYSGCLSNLLTHLDRILQNRDSSQSGLSFSSQSFCVTLDHTKCKYTNQTLIINLKELHSKTIS